MSNDNFASIQHTEALSPINSGQNDTTEQQQQHSTGPAQVNAEPRSRVVEGKMSIQWGSAGGQAIIQQHSPSEYAGEQQPSGMPQVDPSSAKSSTGQPKAISAVLADDDVVKIGGIETRVSVAESQGLLKRDASGRLVDDTGEADISNSHNPGQQQTQDPSRSHMQNLDQADPHAPQSTGDATMDVAVDLLQSQFDSTVAQLVKDDIADGEYRNDTVEAVAQQLGKGVEEAVEYLQTVERGLQAVGTKALESVGVTGDLLELYQEYYGQADAQALDKANADLRHYGNGTKHAQLGRDFMSKLDKVDPAGLAKALTDSGFDVGWDERSKQILVNIDGVGQVAWKDAYTSGAIGTPHSNR
jgi:hypothetical protein